MFKVPIYNINLPKHPRIFDVVVNCHGEIQRYEIQNIRGSIYVDEVEVHKQIQRYLEKVYIAS